MDHINTYPDAMARLKEGCHLFNVGQISSEVLTQLHMAARRGDIKASMDSWPLRGFSGPDQTMRWVFEPMPEPTEEPVVTDEPGTILP